MFNSFLIKTSLLGVAIASSLFSFTNHAEARRCETITQAAGGNIQLRANPNYNFFNFVVDYPNGTNLDVIRRDGNWLEVYAPTRRFGSKYATGWVEESQTRKLCPISNRHRDRYGDRYFRYPQRSQPIYHY